MDTLGERIKGLRQEQGITLRGFARSIGVAPSFIADIEIGRRLPGQKTLAGIADILRVPLSELQALDPRLPPEEEEALRLALARHWKPVDDHLARLEHWRLARLHQAASLLAEVAADELGRRH